MKRLQKPNIMLFAFLVTLVVYGCMDYGKGDIIASELMGTNIAIITPTKGLTSSPTFYNTLTPRWTGTPTKTPIPHQTLIPTTLSPEEVQDWILKRLVDNGGCRLPCWWGITPGKTSWEETTRLLSPYVSDIKINNQNDHLSAGMFFYDTPQIVKSDRIYIGFDIRDEVIRGIGVSGVDGITGYSISELMENYAQPDEIFVYAGHPIAYSVDPRPITVHIWYPEQGIFAEYASSIGKLENGIQQGCLEYGPHFTLVPPGDQRNYQEFISGLGLDLQFPFRPLSEALGIDVDTFYEIYKGIDREVCLETPVKMWVWGDPTSTP